MKLQIASKIANKLNVDHEIIPIKNFLLELPKAISITKQPFWDLHWYYVVKNTFLITYNFWRWW